MAPQEPVSGISGPSATRSQIQQSRALSRAAFQELQQTASEKLAIDYTEQAQFNPLAQLKNAETLERRFRRHDAKTSEHIKKDDDDEIIQVDATAKVAEDVQNRNPEFQKRNLLGLKKAILAEDTPEQILEKVLLSYPDHYLADEALDFLISTSDPKTKIGTNIRLAREILNERFGREVRAGRNTNHDAREFSKQGLGSPGALRDLYRDVTGNPREAITLFEELASKFPFEKMKVVLQFMLHALGSDMKAKGPSISPAELQRLFTEVRSMQAVLGVYRFFFERMSLVLNLFAKQGLLVPAGMSFETLAKLFIKMIGERYPSPDKVLRFARLLGIDKDLLAQIIIFTQYRDAMRGVAPRLFQSEKHRQDMLMVLIETLSDLDDQVAEEEEKEKNKQDKEKDEPDQEKHA